MQKRVYLREVLREMRKLDKNNQPIPFDLKIRAFNKQNKCAGRMITYEGVKLMQKGRKRKIYTNPNHYKNRTRNVKLANGEIKKIHIIFIDEFNGYKINY